MKATSAPTRTLRSRLGLAIIPLSLALTVMSHASSQVASHSHSLVKIVPMLASVNVPFVPAEGLGMALIVGSAMGCYFARLLSARRAVARV